MVSTQPLQGGLSFLCVWAYSWAPEATNQLHILEVTHLVMKVVEVVVAMLVVKVVAIMLMNDDDNDNERH